MDARRAMKWGQWVFTGLVLFSVMAYGRFRLQQPNSQHLELDLGRSIAQIEARSTYRFDPKRAPLDIDIYTVSSPVVITVATAGCPVTFPVGKYAALDVNGGKLDNYDFSPHLRYLTFQEAVTLNHQLVSAIEKAGWRKDPDVQRPSITEVPVRLDEVADGRKIDIDGWRCAGQVMQLRLQRQYRAGSSAAVRSDLKGDSYIVTVNVTTPA